ncbi:MAG: hypothetical protein V3U67_09910 [Gemmatimonadota bacterium]
MTTRRPHARKKAAGKAGPLSAGRIKLVTVDVTRDRGAGFEVRVELEWLGQSFVGEGSGVGHDDMTARLAALATISAVKASDTGPGFDLVGLKRMRAFDGEVVMVCLKESGQSRKKYIGAVAVRETLAGGAANAVLDAVNRVLLYDSAGISAADSPAASDGQAERPPVEKSKLQVAS